MNATQAKEEIAKVREKLLQMQKVASFITLEAFEDREPAGPAIDPDTDMAKWYSKENTELHDYWKELQKLLPAGFSMDSNLIRHLSFNEAHDWYDIANNDIPRELRNVSEYEKRLVLIEYLDGLHPEISRVSEIVLNGDIDIALKAVYASLDVKIRTLLKATSTENTMPLIGQAFKDGRLVTGANTDGARSFLQGVIGFYRNAILHNPLPSQRNSIEKSLSLFALAHEAFLLFDACSKRIQPPSTPIRR